MATKIKNARPRARKRSKKQDELWGEARDPEQVYSLSEGLELLKQSATAKFDETVELAVLVGIDLKNPEQALRGTITLPAGTGKTARVVVFAQGELATQAKQAGADEVGGDDLVEKIEKGFMDFDVVIATPEMMPAVGKLGRTLGPRGLMPNPKEGTVTDDITKAVADFKGGKVGYRTDKTGNIHMPIGKASFSVEDISANLKVAVAEIVRAKPSGVKGEYLLKVAISSTMGPGFSINLGDVVA